MTQHIKTRMKEKYPQYHRLIRISAKTSLTNDYDPFIPLLSFVTFKLIT